ncbi:hypothetical protein LXL04_014733 [Taraxacum kok-saghyz]
MEEPQEVHTDENRALPEKKQKRIVKTPAQVAALENFYNEHKYPTEVMKQDLADSIGLTEKQVSGWFCHRRLKDKKPQTDHEIQPPPGGKQDRSSGVIQDRGSGLRQDSCGSTKQGDTNKQSDPKEVESRRFTSQNIPPTQIQHHNNLIMHHHHDNNDNHNDDDDDDDDDDDTSSGSSSPLKDGFRPQNVDRVGAIASKYPSHDFKSVRGPSGYLKVKGQVENAAITAVKRQLGRHYREDGPPLGIEFEALPPGAFEIPVKIPVNQSYYVGDRTVLHSPDGSRTFQPPNASKMMYERYNPKSYNSMDLDDSRHASSKHREKHFDTQYNNSNNINNNKQTPHHFSKVIRHSHPQMEVNDDDSAEETSVHDMRDHFETRVKHGQSVRRQDSVSNRHLIGYGKNTNHNSRPPKVNHRDRVDSLTSDLTVKRGEFVELEDRGMSRKTPKDNDFDGERRGVDDYSKLISTKIHHGNEMRVTKRNREDFVHQIYPRKEAVIDIPSRTIVTKRAPAQMTSSFSDDETAETTSSAD